MAKVRIQARTSDPDVDDAADHVVDRTDDAEKLVGGSAPHPRGRVKQTGALGLLVRVLRTEGIGGWYQVSFLFSTFRLFLLHRHHATLSPCHNRDSDAPDRVVLKLTFLTGHVSPNYQGRAVPGALIRLQGAVREMGPCDLDFTIKVAIPCIVPQDRSSYVFKYSFFLVVTWIDVLSVERRLRGWSQYTLVVQRLDSFSADSRASITVTSYGSSIVIM